MLNFWSFCGRWTTCKIFCPDFKMTIIFWICWIKTVRQPKNQKIIFKKYLGQLLYYSHRGCLRHPIYSRYTWLASLAQLQICFSQIFSSRSESLKFSFSSSSSSYSPSFSNYEDEKLDFKDSPRAYYSSIWVFFD